MKNAVTLKIRSTQLSESINRDLKYYLKFDLIIIRLLKYFERIVNEKREKKITSDFEWRRKRPKIKVNDLIIQQMSFLYISKIFVLLQAEYELSMTAQIEGLLSNDYMVVIVVFSNHDIYHKCHKVL
jgi:hypothetical protein